MNKTTIWIIVVAVLGALAVWLFWKPAAPTFGAANVSPGNAMNNQSLVNELNLIANPLVAVGNGATASIDFPNLTTSTIAQSTTTVVTGLAGALGDQVLVSPVTPTTGAVFTGYVSTASTTSATFTMVEQLSAGSAVDATGTVLNVIVLPALTFKAPVGL